LIIVFLAIANSELNLQPIFTILKANEKRFGSFEVANVRWEISGS
jgi:hypothetical protein